MNAAKGSAWLGYRVMGGRMELGESCLRNSIAILGKGAQGVAAALVHSLVESSVRVGVVDIGVGLSSIMSGYLESFGASYVMHDSMLLGENGQLHARLLASAYSTVLNLPSEQEDLLNAALQESALEEGEASPMGIVPMIGVVEGFKGPEKMELSGRVATLRFVESTGDPGAVRKLLSSSFIVDFSGAKTGELAEASAAIFLAKLLSLADPSAWPDLLVVTGAERLFRSFRVPRHSSYLRTCIVGAGFGVVFAADSGHALDQPLVEGCPLRLYSGDLWNEMKGEPRALPNMFVMQNFANDSVEAFVPREFEPRAKQAKEGGAQASVGEQVERRILELVLSSEAATRTSVVSVLSPEFPAGAVAAEVDRLQREGCLAFVKFGQGRDSPSSVLVLMELGKKRLGELRGSGESPDPV
jgi:hypothetical protein